MMKKNQFNHFEVFDSNLFNLKKKINFINIIIKYTELHQSQPN